MNTMAVLRRVSAVIVDRPNLVAWIRTGVRILGTLAVLGVLFINSDYLQTRGDMGGLWLILLMAPRPVIELGIDP